MEVAACIFLLVVACLDGTGATLGLQDATVTAITRLNNGDIFAADGGECNSDSCVGLSSGTAIAASSEDAPVSKGPCTCQCHRHLPAFREDLHICVDDIHECVLAPFVSGSTSQKIPFVFLPLKGQIIHPSKEISFTGVQTPICAVSGAKFLTESGWMDLRSPLDSDVPFRLFRDEGRTFLQWVGDSELRTRMSGRLVLVHLLCRELGSSEQVDAEIQSIFTPCVAFRVVGTPTKYLYNVSEVIFSADAHAAEDSSGGGLSITEYIAIGISSVLLGLIYVASVFLYLHIRKRRRDSDKKPERRDNQSLTTVEEGVVKNNPLLGLGRNFSGVDNSYSDSGSSDTDLTSDALQKLEERKKNMQITSALIHPPQIYYDTSPYSSKLVLEMIPQDSPSIERHPEENVSIVETIEGREDRPDTVRAISGTTRRKLYFNPAYFEPELLLAPPPAAVEFLVKIREVISIAKQKMECKRFTPSLLGIPEEDTNHSVEPFYDLSRALSSRRSSMISLKRENSRRRTCTGCPACEPQDLKALCGKLPEFPSLAACKSCTTSTGDSKQRSIQRWLEDVPVLKPLNNEDAITKSLRLLSQSLTSPKRLRSPTRSLSPEHISPPFRTLSPRPASERARSPTGSDTMYGLKTLSVRSQPSSKSLRRVTSSNVPTIYRKPPLKPKAPPPPLPAGAKPSPRQQPSVKIQQTFPSPSTTHTTMITNKPTESKFPTITRKYMKAVIDEFESQHGINSVNKSSDSSSSPELGPRQGVDYETDSLERSGANRGYTTPTEYVEVSSSQPSPSLSSALPMAEEMTMRNAILNTKTGNMTVSKLNIENLRAEGNHHEYELIVLKKGETQNSPESSLYKLPELLQRNNGYSLVSEVYVNNGYNFGSTPSSPSDSNCSTMEKKAAKINYEQPEAKPGRLTIEVEDCPDNYIKVEDSDSFEPDTLDRKPSKMSIPKTANNDNNDYVDSLERPNQILLRTTGSFNTLTPSSALSHGFNPGFHRAFGSLREIYEYKTKNHLRLSAENLTSLDRAQSNDEFGFVKWKHGAEGREYEGRILTLEDRHSKRQRRLNPQTLSAVPPDVIPPPPHSNSPIYEHPKPPRKVLDDGQEDMRPPLPPKNGIGRSTSQNYHKEENVPASPTSDKSYDIPPSSLSGASVSPTSSDYETCTLGAALKKNSGDSDASVLKRLIHSEDVLFKNAINNQFILQTSVVTSSPNLINKMPLKSLRSLMESEDTNNNSYLAPGNLKHSDNIKQAWNKLVNAPPNHFRRKPIDSGYLSTDSNESYIRKQNESEKDTSGAGSETDESFGDGHSESGAESVETHSVFFGSYRKPYYMTNTCDSGTGSELRTVDSSVTHGDDCASTDSETMSYTTVVPVGSERSGRSSTRSSIVIEH